MVRYAVTLTDDEIQDLKAIIQKGGKGYRIKHAQILLKPDRKPCNDGWTYDRIKEAFGTGNGTIAGIAKRFVTEGMQAALERKKQQNRYRKVTGDVEAKICAIACSGAPEGRSEWTMQAIADELIRLEVVDYITDSTVYDVMKKMNSNRGLLKNGAFRKRGAEFVADMEDVLEVCQRPYDPLRPVVCIDETNKQLIKEERIPCEPGKSEKVDCVYVRNGVADVFMISEPLAGRRETVVTETRNAVGFAQILKYTSDVLYPRAEKIVLVTDNLNIHTTALLYKAFQPEEARRLANHFEWHYTPKHGSWLDMAEIEIGVMSRQALAKPLPNIESFKEQVRTWTVKRNAESRKIN